MQDAEEKSQFEIAMQPTACEVIDWYSEGDARIVQVGDVQIEVRLVGRSGRRSRIAIKAPAGAVFR